MARVVAATAASPVGSEPLPLRFASTPPSLSLTSHASPQRCTTSHPHRLLSSPAHQHRQPCLLRRITVHRRILGRACENMPHMQGTHTALLSDREATHTGNPPTRRHPAHTLPFHPEPGPSYTFDMGRHPTYDNTVSTPINYLNYNYPTTL